MDDKKPTKYNKKSAFGALGETIASKFLINKGYRILKRNYRKPWGEIDIVCEKADTVHFVEVKSVSRERSTWNISREMDYRPEEMVHPTKLNKLARTAEIYMSETNDDREYQIDAIGVLVDTGRRVARCRFFEQIL